MSIQSEAHFFTTRYHTKPLTSRLLGKEAADTQGFPAVSDGGSLGNTPVYSYRLDTWTWRLAPCFGLCQVQHCT